MRIDKTFEYLNSIILFFRKANYMRRFVLGIAVIAAFFILDTADAQTIYSSGNLLRIPFDSKQVNTADTLKAWNDRSFDSLSTHSYSYTKYFDLIRTPLRSYFLKKYENSFSSQYYERYEGKQFIEGEGLLNSRQIGILPGPGWDVHEPYMLNRTIIIETKNGLMLNNGAFGNAFLFNNDSLLQFKVPYPNVPITTTSELLKAIVGRVNDKYMAVLDDKNSRGNYKYFLINPDDLPNIDTVKSVKISIMGDSTFLYNPRYYAFPNTITRMRKITGDLYALTSERGQGLSIYKFSDTAFYYIKTVLKDDTQYGVRYTPQWEIRNNKLFLLSAREIVSFEFQSSDTTFINRQMLLDSLYYPTYYTLYGVDANFGIDRNLKYAAKIFRGPEKKYQDTLKIFDIDRGSFINGIVLNSIKDPFMPVVDSPYVYVHQIMYKYTGLEENNNAVVKVYKLSAYPNPFNPVTTISYSIPKESHVELKVYDMLGREVTTLVNKAQAAGEYRIHLDGSSLPSGIYIYSMYAGEYRASKKLMILK